MTASTRSRNAWRWLVAYVAAALALGAVSEPTVLAAALAVALAASGTLRRRLVRRTLAAVAAFNATVSAGYVVLTWLQGGFSATYLTTINLRVALLVYLGFWFITRVDLRLALARWPTLAMVATLAAGQAGAFARALRDFRLAFRSRNPGRAGAAAAARHAASQAVYLLDRADAAATRSALAMRSRGVFADD